MIELVDDLGVDVEWTGAKRSRSGPPTSRSTPLDRALASASAPRSCWPARCWRAAGAVDVPPPGGDVIGRRRVDTHLLAFAGAGRRRRRSSATTGLRRAGGLQRRRDLPRRGQRDRHRERDHGRRAGAGTDRDHERRLRAARAGPVPAAGQDGRPHRGHRLERAGDRRASTRLRGCEHRVGSDHIEVASFIGLAAVTGGDVTIEDASRRAPARDPAGVRAGWASRSRSTAATCASRRTRSW